MAKTVLQIIEQVRELKPCPYSDQQLTYWLTEIECKLQMEIMLLEPSTLTEYAWPDDKDAQVLVGAPYTGIYVHYLEAMIDFANGEYDKYQNSYEMMNAVLGEYARWYAKRYNPAGGRMEAAGYYMSAYSIAVKHGYAGTEEQWLMTIRGPEGPKGDDGEGLNILGHYATKAELEAAVTDPDEGDTYTYGTDLMLTRWSGTAFTDSSNLRGPQGATGAQGPQGNTGSQGPKGDTGAGFVVKGYYATLAALEAGVPNPQTGDAYGVGAASPYDIYIYDGVNHVWVNNGHLQGAKGDTGDPGPNTVTTTTTTTITGLLKGNGSTVAQAVAGQDYVASETDPTVPSWAKAETKPTYTYSEVGADASGAAASAVSTHDASASAHSSLFAAKAGVSTYESYTLLSASWSSGQYDLTSAYPTASWNIMVAVDYSATSTQFDAFVNAKIVGSSSSNILKALGTTPTTDIPVLIRKEPK